MDLSVITIGGITVAGVVVSCVTFFKGKNILEHIPLINQDNTDAGLKNEEVEDNEEEDNNEEEEDNEDEEENNFEDEDKTKDDEENNDENVEDIYKGDREVEEEGEEEEEKEDNDYDGNDVENMIDDEEDNKEEDVEDDSDEDMDEDIVDDKDENEDEVHEEDTGQDEEEDMEDDEDEHVEEIPTDTAVREQQVAIESCESEDNSFCVRDMESVEDVSYHENRTDIFSQNIIYDMRNEKLKGTIQKKIQYDELKLISIGKGGKICKGRFEGNIKVAVKKVLVDVDDVKKITKEMTSLQRKLNKTVQMNQKIMAIGNENIVKYFCYEFEIKKQVHLLLALERCDRNLFQFIQDRASLQDVSDKEIFIQLTSGLQFLHSRKIMHRDLKPENVLVKAETHGETVFKLSDFGMSKTGTETESSASMSGPCGTCGWMAPEVFTNDTEKQIENARRFRRKSDIFPLGQIFYFVACKGNLVFRNQDAIQKNDPTFIHIPRKRHTVFCIINNMLDPNYRNRPSAQQVLNHPALWSTKKSLEFLHQASVLLETEQNGCKIEDGSLNIFGDNWQQHLSQNVDKHLFPTASGQLPKKGRYGPSYKRKSLRSLLRAIRNNKEHYLDLTTDLKSEFGVYPDEYLRYWTGRFPELLMHSYDAIKHTYSTHFLLTEFFN